MTLAPRCDFSNILIPGCPHCKAVPHLGGRSRADQLADAMMGPWTDAKYEGACHECGVKVEPGDAIRSAGRHPDGSTVWVCGDCGLEEG